MLPRLQSLTLHECDLWGCVAEFQQQLQALPGLQELSIDCCEYLMPEDKDGQEHAAAVADSCSAQLVSFLWLNCTSDSVDDTQHVTVLFSKPWPQLQKLHLPIDTIQDGMMELLLQQAPSLKQLQVEGFQLTGDFSSRQCRWKEVDMQSSIDIASLARMPLSSRPSIRVGTSVVCVCLPSSKCSTESQILQVTAAAAAAVEHCGGIQPSEAPDILSGPCYPRLVCFAVQPFSAPAVPPSVLMATVPMLRNIVQVLELGYMCVTKQLLAAISSHLPHCRKLSFGRPCTLEEGIWDGMISLLPRVCCLGLYPQSATLQQVATLCATATHPISLHLKTAWFRPDSDEEGEGEGAWREVLQQAQRDAGHNYVEVWCLDEDGIESKDDGLWVGDKAVEEDDDDDNEGSAGDGEEEVEGEQQGVEDP